MLDFLAGKIVAMDGNTFNCPGTGWGLKTLIRPRSRRTINELSINTIQVEQFISNNLNITSDSKVELSFSSISLWMYFQAI